MYIELLEFPFFSTSKEKETGEKKRLTYISLNIWTRKKFSLYHIQTYFLLPAADLLVKNYCCHFPYWVSLQCSLEWKTKPCRIWLMSLESQCFHMLERIVVSSLLQSNTNLNLEAQSFKDVLKTIWRLAFIFLMIISCMIQPKRSNSSKLVSDNLYNAMISFPKRHHGQSWVYLVVAQRIRSSFL